MSNNTESALSVALYKMLRPMVRLLMRHGVTYRHFADVVRHVYVDVAREDFGLPGRKPSFARIAVLTGINRKDIAKLKERPHPLQADPSADGQKNPVARVIDGWLNDGRFRDDNGRPAELPIENDFAEKSSGEPDFSLLVREYSSDVPVRALLDEMLRIGAAEKNDGRVRLVTKGYIPHVDVQESLRIVGTATADLLNTMDYNLSTGGAKPRIQRTVSYSDIPVELLEQIRQRSNEEGETFLLQVNDWLSQCDRPIHSAVSGLGRARAGIGIYYFEYPEVEQANTNSDPS